MSHSNNKPKSVQNPGVRAKDHVYFQHGDDVRHGRVLACGAHGATVDCDGSTHRVTWDRVLGHKKRAKVAVRIVDQGEDGAIVEDERGRRQFLRNNDAGDEPKKEIDDMQKSGCPGTRMALLAKALAPGRAGLILKDTHDQAGHNVKRWMKNGEDPAAAEKPGKGEDGFPHPHGAAVRFKAGTLLGGGKIVARGRDGATIEDSSGRRHQVHWHEVTGKVEGPDEKKPDGSDKEEVKQIPPERFSAKSFAKAHDDPGASEESILKDFPPDTKGKIQQARERLAGIKQTQDEHMRGGRWSAERQKLHRDILVSGYEMDDPKTPGQKIKVPGILSAERIKAATPQEGQAPVFILLGGRGGSGKSSFDGEVYQSERCIVLDADHIKGLLPEYEGWNAHQVHEESSEMIESAMNYARILGVNVVLDATMKTTKSALEKVDAFKAAGYRTEAHYMHLPRQEAAKRAVGRFINGGVRGRFVPPEVVLSNTTNEGSFDEVRKKVDAWSFRDNNVPKGQPPVLVSQYGEPLMKRWKILHKSNIVVMLLMRRK